MAAKEYHETNIVVSSIGMAATPPAAPSSPATCPPLRTPTKNPSRLDLFVFFSLYFNIYVRDLKTLIPFKLDSLFNINLKGKLFIILL